MKFTEKIILEAAHDAYQNGNVPFHVEREKCALLVIDMQDEFVKPHWTASWVPEATRQVPKIKQLIEHCRTIAVPVVYTAFKNTHGFMDRPFSSSLMPNRYPQFGNDNNWFNEGEIWHELTPEKDDIVIYKPSYGAFYDTPLETILRNLGRDTIIVCGTLTNYCCGTTARQGYERGFKVVFGSDITSTDIPEMQEYELQVLRKGFAKVLPLKEIVQLLGQ